MADFKDRAWMNVSGTPGTGNITLGTVVAGNQSFTDAGAVDGTQYGYVVVDGNDWEEGSGTPSSSVTVFQRTTVSRSVIAGVAGTTKLTLSGSAQIFLTARTVDLQDASLLKTGTIVAALLPAASTSTQGAVQAADQAAQEASTAGRAVTSDVQKFHPSAAKVWCKWGVTTTIDGSYGVSSITDNGPGDWTINFSTNFSAVTSYVTVAMAENSALNNTTQLSQVRTVAVGSVRLITSQTVGSGVSAVDPLKNNLVCFGDQ